MTDSLNIPILKMTALAGLILAAAGLSGCASAGDGDQARLPSSAGECVFVRTLSNWRAIDRESLVIYAPSRNHPYKVDLLFPCHGLRFAETIAFTSRDQQLCDFRSEAIIVDGQRCPIGRIEPITVEEAKALTSRKKNEDEGDEEENAGEAGS